MSIGFYFDEHMPRVVADDLKQRGYVVTMAVDVGLISKDDDTEHLKYATEHKLVVVTFDRPFSGRTMYRSDHSGLICLSESLQADIGGIIRVLVEFGETHISEEVTGQVYWLK